MLLLDLKKSNGIEDLSLQICGNCIKYNWDIYGDRHKGWCKKEKKNEDFINTVVLPNGIHALTNAKSCPSFVLDKNN